ncbi:PucR family transcriptional regulator [Amycolatopsis sp. NPDC004378]
MKTATIANDLKISYGAHTAPIVAETIGRWRERCPVSDRRADHTGRIAERLVRWNLHSPRPDEDVPAGMRRLVHRLARRCAARDVPKDTLVSCVLDALTVTNRVYWGAAEPEDAAGVTALTQHASRVVKTLIETVDDAYYRELSETGNHLRARSVLIDQLLRGNTRSDAARRFADEDFASCWVIVLRGPGPQLRSLAANHLSRVTAGEGIVLLQGSGELAKWEALSESAEAAGLSGAACFARDLAEIPACLANSRLAAGLCHAAGHRGVLPTECLLLESALATTPSLAAGLTKPLRPLGPRPDLMLTLAEFYRNDLDRQRTARRLGVDRRTLTNRLTRIRRLTGLDPLSSSGIRILTTALTAKTFSPCENGPGTPE